jgi:hypothetical protein
MTDLPLYDSLTTGVADVLDRRLGTVHMWAKRRRTTKFPLHKALYRAGSRLLCLYDINEVKQWHAEYVPSPGGAPLGNRNWVPKQDKVLTPKAG